MSFVSILKFNVMKKILVPIDFSEYAMNAYTFACEIAEKTKGEVTLIHVIEYPAAPGFNTTGEVTMNTFTDAYMIELVKKAKGDLEELTFNKHFSELKITYKIELGNPYENIAKVIDDEKADLVVMGTKGSSGLHELFIGSNAEKVVRFAQCPVITVPGEVHFDNIKNIVFGVSLDEDQEDVVMKLKGYVHLFNAHVDMVWVRTPMENDDEDSVKEKIHEMARRQLLPDYSVNVIKAIQPDEGLMYYAEEKGSDMIAMATHSRKGLAHIFTGSFAEDVVNHSKRPVWTAGLKNK